MSDGELWAAERELTAYAQGKATADRVFTSAKGKLPSEPSSAAGDRSAGELLAKAEARHKKLSASFRRLTGFLFQCQTAAVCAMERGAAAKARSLCYRKWSSWWLCRRTGMLRRPSASVPAGRRAASLQPQPSSGAAPSNKSSVADVLAQSNALQLELRQQKTRLRCLMPP
ncbi:hypothetical protein DIPPA_00474 [Diplonema papillatum]|nr:hypothetical protein DIPPA_00474 [Diplonema papillatum]